MCLPGLAACGATCVDLNEDGDNCGACDVGCEAGLVCSLGSCAENCADGLGQCGQSCADFSSSALHCGSCDVFCSSGQCTSGACAGAAGAGSYAGNGGNAGGAGGGGGSSNSGGTSGTTNVDRGVFWNQDGGYGYEIGVYPDTGTALPEVSNVDGVLTVKSQQDASAVFFGFDDSYMQTADFSGYQTVRIVYRASAGLRAYLMWGADPGENWALVGTGSAQYVVPYFPDHDGGAQEFSLPASGSWKTIETVIASGVQLDQIRQFNFTSIADGATVEFQEIALLDDPVVETLAKFEPPRGRTYVAVGEFSSGVSDYVSTVGVPAGILYYLTTNWNTGWSEPGTYDTLAYYNQNYAGTFLQLGLFLDAAACSYVQQQQNGDQNPYLDDLAGRIKASQRPVFLRIGYEFDNVEAGHGCGGNVEQYKAVFRQIVHQLRDVDGADNVAFVWHTRGAEGEIDQSHLTSWYPGDDYVDWLGISLFGYSFEFKINPLNELYAFAEARNKPITIAESSITESGPTGTNLWNSWFSGVDYYADYHDRVKMWSFIHENWGGKFGFSFDSRFNGALANYASSWQALLAKERYLVAADISFAADGSEITVR